MSVVVSRRVPERSRRSDTRPYDTGEYLLEIRHGACINIRPGRLDHHKDRRRRQPTAIWSLTSCIMIHTENPKYYYVLVVVLVLEQIHCKIYSEQRTQLYL